MSRKVWIRGVAVTSLLLFPFYSNAWFFIFPIPNVSKPRPLEALIEALEKSEETKAVAYASEDKTFGQKYWVWGHFSGHVPQAEADRIALSRCQGSLEAAKSQLVGGKPLYDFGTKVCELHNFTNKSVSPRAAEWQPPSMPAPSPVAPITAPSQQTPPPSASAASTPTSSSQQQTSESSAKPQAPVPRPAPPDVTPATQPQSTAPATTETPTARRLRELESLRKEGLITDAEYQEKRKAILAAM